MIRTFGDSETERLFHRVHSKRFAAIERVAFRKLRMPHYAASLQDLTSLPGNRLEALKGDRKGQHSIRINDQYRVCFEWGDGHAFEVEIVDYH
jgi:proteic killer suppression protein